MKIKINKIIGIICYVLSLVLIGHYLILEFSLLNVTSPINRIKIIILIVLLMIIGARLLYKDNKEKLFKLSKINLIIWFLLYIVMLLNLTLFDKYFGREGAILNISDVENIVEYLDTSFNMVPFATIDNYLLALRNNNLSVRDFIYNIFGNIIAFMPLSFFLPRLFKSIDKWYELFLDVSLFIIFIEGMQFLMMSGSFDIDDYILNVMGAMIMHFILNNKFSFKFINKFMYLKC